MFIERVKAFEKYDLTLLLEESVFEGYNFIAKLLDEYTTGINRFDGMGEALFAVIRTDEVIGIGGLNRDPYLNRSDVGRVRHLYVLPAYRNMGTGKALLLTIIEEAKKHFQLLTLYTENRAADKMYRDAGFSRADGVYKASHVLELARAER